jgi:uncharacterized delta-60 repeat protein
VHEHRLQFYEVPPGHPAGDAPARAAVRKRRAARRGGIAGLAVALVALSAGLALAATAGELDPSFDGDGKRVLPIRIDPGDVVAQPDGKVLVTDSRSFRIVRLNTDGSFDEDFAGDGVAAADFGAGASINAVALQPDGKIVLVGRTATEAIAVARLNPGGSLDPTFSPGGADGDGKHVLTGLLTLASATAVAVQADGKIILSGAYSNGITAIRLDSAGEPDGTTYENADDFNDSESVEAATIDPHGSLVVVGNSTTSDDPDVDAVVARFKDDGKLDKSLGGTGWVKLGPNDRDDTASAVFVRPDGKIVLGGDSGSAEKNATVTRLNEDGTPDDSFGEGGLGAPDFTGAELAAGFGLQPDGKVLVAATLDPELKFAVGRLDASGNPDPSFGSGGKTTIAFDDIAIANAAGVQADGRFVIAGVTAVDNRTSARTAVARVLADQPPQTGGEGPGAGPGVVPESAPRCGGKEATIVGTAGRDTLRGTRRADVIVALGGNDRVVARGGKDLVCGGRGRDRLVGGGGKDRLAGGPQRDTCIGGAARDRASTCEIRRSL